MSQYIIVHLFRVMLHCVIWDFPKIGGGGGYLILVVLTIRILLFGVRYFWVEPERHVVVGRLWWGGGVPYYRAQVTLL